MFEAIATAALAGGQLRELREWRRALDSVPVAVAYGGVSAEDRLYLAESPASGLSVNALTAGLAGLGVDAAVLDPCQPGFIADLLGYEIVMPCMHGPYGEDGRLQGLLDYLRKPYACSGVAASALAADKALCKLALAGLGVPTPRWCRPGEDPARFLARYGQIMVKPRMGGSSVGMSLVSRGGDLDAAISQARATDGLEPVLEEYVAGDSVTVGLLQLPAGVIVLPPPATRPRHAAFYDARANTARG